MLSTPTAIKMIEEDMEELREEKARLIVERDNKEDEQVDIQTIVNYAIYYMEHLHELILETDKPDQKGVLFGLLFDEPPTYEDLVNGTPYLASIFKLQEEYETSEGQMVGCQGLEP